MGALHAGHAALIEQSVRENDVTCASIFVNALQFNNPDDLAAYPDTFDDDLKLLYELGCDMVYTGTLAEFFPEADDPFSLKQECPSPAGRGLEGDYRPGHLAGVWMIVERLFRTVGSCRAYFGEKDFQQLQVVTDLAGRMSNSDDLSIEIVPCATVREPDGLALSSRNVRLEPKWRQRAPSIYQGIQQVQCLWNQGERNASNLESAARDILAKNEFVIDYVAVRNADQWTADTPTQLNDSARVLVAVYAGEVRLIDNAALQEAD